MEVSAVSSVEGLNSVGVAKPADPTQARTFSRLIADQLNDVNLEQLNADETVKSFAKGETDNVHDVVMAVAKADLSFRMVLEIRNRLIESYQEVMRMQV